MQKADREFLHFLGKNKIPFALVFTKTDKVSKSQQERNAEQYKKVLLETWQTLPDIFLSSARTNSGRDEILEFIQRTMDGE
jgi:GTP-binding protein